MKVEKVLYLEDASYHMRALLVYLYQYETYKISKLNSDCCNIIHSTVAPTPVYNLH